MRSRENFLMHVMNCGFDKAAASFSKLIHRPVRIVNSQFVLIRHDNDFSCMSEEQGDLNILVTQIIGDISGKSYLIFNHDESEEIFRALKTSVSNEALNKAFLMEIDNIISASVIGELSNALKLEIYGDVPHLFRIHSSELQEFMNQDSNAEPSSIIFSNTTFQFDTHERVHPQFIWKLSTKVFEMIPEADVPRIQV